MGTAPSSEQVLKRELAGERVHALTCAMEALESALAQLAAAPHDQALRAEACERLWFVVVQRETLGMYRHEVLFEVLRIPPSVQSGMGLRHRR